MAKHNGNIDLLQAYPVLTEASTTNGAPPSIPRIGGASSFGQLIDGTLREVLAWRPRTTDPKGFVAALNQAFTVTEKDGHTEWTWTPRSYTIQADMGAVTGAQASIYARAQNALDQALPLLSGLYPLRPDADTQDAEAVQSLVQSAMIELVGELGQVGGPRLQRVDAHIKALLGDATSDARQEDAESIGGLLGTLRERYGMEQRLVNTISEEQNLTNYRILVDHLVALRHTWVAQRHFFNRKGTDVFLGTQLVLLSRALAAMGDAVENTVEALDSVYIHAGERQVTQLPLNHHSQHEFALTADEFLTWILAVASEEGPRAINEGGKDGVVALQPILNDLHRLAQDFLELVGSDSQQHRDLPPGLFTPRVRVAAKHLDASIGEASMLANKIRRSPSPRVNDADPNPIVVTTNPMVVSLYVEGENFQPGLRISLKRIMPNPNKFAPAWIEDDTTLPKQIEADKVHVISVQSARASLALTPDHAGDWRLIITNSDGGSDTFEPIMIKVPDALVAAPPLAFTATPNEGHQGESLVLTLTATSGAFDPDSTFSLGSDIGIDGDLKGDGQQLSATIYIMSDAIPTTRDIKVSGDSVTKLPQAFRVLPARGTGTPTGGTRASPTPLHVTDVRFVNGSSKTRGTKLAVPPADFDKARPLSAKEGIDTIEVIFDQKLEHVGQSTDVVHVTHDGKHASLQSTIRDNSVILERRDAAGALDNFPVGQYTIRIPKDTSSLLAGSALPDDVTVTFEITE